ncbi:MAG TPA: hypothetical protein VGL88_05665 [Pseudonocardiaceae bacterium]
MIPFSAGRWWALEPQTLAVHLLDGEYRTGALRARCGHLLSTTVARCDQPPPGTPCEDCRRIFIADFTNL